MSIVKMQKRLDKQGVICIIQGVIWSKWYNLCIMLSTSIMEKKVIARNTSTIFCHTFIVEVVLCHKYCKNYWMNIKFKAKLPTTIENVLELFQFFQNQFNRQNWISNICHTYGFGRFGTTKYLFWIVTTLDLVCWLFQ